MSSKDLYRILKDDRDALPDFLKENCKYDYLKSLLREIEDINTNETKQINMIISLFLGTFGLESNKQKAIYELPTEELLTILKYICEFLEINNIEELCAGQGILSHMLSHYLGDNYTVNATDGFRWIETTSRKRYYNVTKKLFLNYCLDNTVNFDDKLLIISWMPDKDIQDFHKLLEMKTPKNLVIIGCPTDKHIVELRTKLKNLGYSGVNIPVKQLCYRDYFKDNKYFPEDSCRSSMMFVTKEIEIEKLNTLLLNIKLKYNDCLCKKIDNISDKCILQDIIIRYIDNFYLINELDNESKFKKILKYCKQLMKKGSITIPNYLENYNEFMFWVKKALQSKYPLKIISRDKFKEYEGLITILENDNGLNELKEIDVLPDWIDSVTTAEKYIWLEYSNHSKKWKQTRNSFLTMFNTVYSTIGASSLVSFASLIN